MVKYRDDQLKKSIQVIPFHKPVEYGELHVIASDRSVRLDDKRRERIDANWRANHPGWLSSPISNFECIKVGYSSASLSTSVTEYKDYKGADVLAGEGDLEVLDMVQPVGNEVLMITADEKVIFGLRGSEMPICPSEYDCGGSLNAAMYAMDNSKLRERENLPPNERFSKDELKFDFRNPMDHVMPAIEREHGVKPEEVNKESMRILGFVRGLYGGRNPSAAISIRLKIDSEEYLGKRREKVDYEERSKGKPQPQKRVEVEQTVFIEKEDLAKFIASGMTVDSKGKSLEAHPMSGRTEIVDNAIGTAALFISHSYDWRINELLGALKINGIDADQAGREGIDLQRFQIEPWMVA
jgi:hypothetical protein